MSGYRRFIAYVYEYQKGKKGSNCGFLKVEVKDQQCSVEVHLHCPGLPADIPCRFYGFIRKDGLINGILLDTCETESETVECLIETDALNMNGSDVSLAKMGGMVLVTDAGSFFGTEWDDQTIRPENFRELKQAASQGNSAYDNTVSISPSVPAASDTTAKAATAHSDKKSNKVSAASEISTVPDITTTSQELSDSAENIVSSAPSEQISDNISESPKVSHPEASDTQVEPVSFTVPDKFINAESNTKPQASIMPEKLTQPQQMLNSEEIPQTKQLTEPKDSAQLNQNILAKENISTNEPERPKSISDSNSPNSTPANASSLAQSAVLKESASHSEAAHHSKVSSQAASQPQPFTPFSDGELAAAWKIHLNDLKQFSRRYNALRNNRFIQYGHYNFGHLLLGQRNDGQYILGVPGGYNQQERFMANMFGFPYFKESTYIELPRARGGYWYNLIDAPDSHR